MEVKKREKRVKGENPPKDIQIKVYAKPNSNDLLIYGELLGIEINQLSFIVRYNWLLNDENIASPLNLLVWQKVFPIRYFQRFLKANANVEMHHYLTRPKHLMIDDYAFKITSSSSS